MNRQIEKLYRLSKKSNRLIIGLMSGTSLDGLDIALCNIHNTGTDTQLELLQFITMPYDDELRNHIRTIFAKRIIDQELFCGINAYVGITHANLINKALDIWSISSNEVDLIASHGQTVYHAPQSLTKSETLPNSTLQIGDADHIAVHTGIITISDFRQKHVAAGGEGAPLAAYGDYLLFTDNEEHRILLNIGGISNFTFLPKRASNLKAFATDLGPGNTIMNQYMFTHFDKEMDEHAAMAIKGKPHSELLNALLQDDFLKAEFPKTTGPELFNLAYLQSKLDQLHLNNLAHDDIMATLNIFSAQAIIYGILQVTKGLDNVSVYVSGGGLHNPLLMDNLKAGLPEFKVTSIGDIAMNPDAKEACLFALLANETIAGTPENMTNIKESPAICMGKISLPE